MAKRTRILIIAVVILAVGAGLVWYLSPPAPSAPEGATATSTPIDISHWKTYTNAQFGFSIMYPPAWGILARASGTPPNVVIGNPISGLQTYALMITRYPNPQGLTAQAYVAQMLAQAEAEDASNAKGGPAPTLTPRFAAQYALQEPGYNAYELYSVFEFDHQGERIYVKNGNEMLVFDFPIAAENPNLSDPLANNAIVHKMLTTLTLMPPAL